MSLFEFSF